MKTIVFAFIPILTVFPFRSLAEALKENGISLIQESNSLTSDQKKRLTELTIKMNDEMNTIRSQESKLKMVLFKTIVNPKAETREITTLKNRVIAPDRQKTNKMLSALDEAQKIMGRRDERDEKFYRSLMLERAEPGTLLRD